ncbi:MAG: HEAT repeat domain-containing protein [Planctomycetaceae bacterium]
MLQSLAVPMHNDPHPEVRRYAVRLLEPTLRQGKVNEPALEVLKNLAQDPDTSVRLQVLLSLGECPDDSVAEILAKAFRGSMADDTLRAAAYSSLTEQNIRGTLAANLEAPSGELNERLILMLVGQAAEFGETSEIGRPLKTLMASIDENASADRYTVVHTLLMQMSNSEAMKDLRNDTEFTSSVAKAVEASLRTARNADADERIRGLALRFSETAMHVAGRDPIDVTEFTSPQMPPTLQKAATTILALRSDDSSMRQLIQLWPTLTPELRHGVIEIAESREAAISLLLAAKETFTSQDFNAAQRDLLLNHRSERVKTLARELFGEDHLTARSAVVDDFKSQISNFKFEISKEEQIVSGKRVFEKRCATCHRLQDVGKEVGADLAALKDRSTDSLLTAILDPNKAVEAKFLTYTVVTKEGLQYSGMLKSETGGSMTLIGSDGVAVTIPRANIEELVSTKRSLMPEGLEKDLTVQDLASVVAFVQSTGTPWKRFDGNGPRTVQPDADGTITLPAAAAEIYGPNLVFESKYGNLGFWTSTDDYAKWTFDVPSDGFWTVELDFACDDSTAGSLIRFSTGTRMLTARVPGTGSWDNYETYRAGTIDLHEGKGQLILTAPAQPPFALIDLRAVRLIPPGK